MDIVRRVETLSDGSKVHNVLVSDQETALEFHCVTERDAAAFEAKLYCAIQGHTVDAIRRGA